MTIINAVYVPEGIAMAADSRLTGYRTAEDGVREFFTISDNAQKLFLLQKASVGIATCGEAIVEDKTIADFLRIFEIEHLSKDDDVQSVSKKLNEYVKENGVENKVIFQVAGFSDDLPYVYLIKNGNVNRVNYEENQVIYGVTWSGEPEVISKLLKGDKGMVVSYHLMPLKDAIDFSHFLVDITIKYHRFQDKIPTCGGPVDVLVITKDYARFVKHKIFNP